MMLTRIFLMAGRGTRTRTLNGDLPKPLIPIHEIPMIRWVIHNVSLNEDCRDVFVVQKKDFEDFDLNNLLSIYSSNPNFVLLDGYNEGAAISALMARKYFSSEVLFINCDQYVDFEKETFLKEARNHDGFILTMNNSGPKWSYVQVNDANHVVEVAEKREISNLATVGIYWFRSGHIFESAVEAMVAANDRHNNEFYLAPTFNYAIKQGHQIGHYNIKNDDGRFYGLGTTDDINLFINNKVSLEIKSSIEKK